MIPLNVKLKKEAHRKLALCQDLIVENLYSVFNDAVLHGGTAIWRCYNGNRFSEDVDVYIQKNTVEINLLFEKLEAKGFVIEKKKIGEKSLYSTLKMDRTSVRFEAIFKKHGGVLKEYQKADGNLITVYTLTAEGFILEKVEAYLKRLKIRDLYDIFFLMRYVTKSHLVKDRLRELLSNYSHPTDENELRVLVIDGLVPKAEKMLEYIRSKL